MISILAESDRLRICRLDGEAVAAALDDRPRFEQLMHASVDADWPLGDMRDLLGFVRTHLGANSSAAHWGGVIVTKEPLVVIGDVGFHASPVDGQVEIGYSIVPSHRRRGLATEAVSAFLRWGFQHPEVHDVLARVSEDNPHSVRVLEKAGFEFYAATDGVARYKISRSSVK